MGSVFMAQWAKDRRKPLLLIAMSAAAILLTLLFAGGSQGPAKVAVFGSGADGAEAAAAWQRLLHEGRAASVVEIAQAEQIDITQVRRLLRLTLLAPTVIETLLREPQHRLDPVLRQPWATLWQDQCRQIERLHHRDAPEASSTR